MTLPEIARLIVTTCFVVCASTLSAQTSAPTGDTLGNQAVIDMVAGKLSKNLIVQKVKSTPARFDVSAMALIALNNAKVPSDLIKLMMDLPQGSLSVKPPASDEKRDLAQSAPNRTVVPTQPPPPSLPPPPPPAPVAREPKAALKVLPVEAGIHLRGTGGPITILEPNTYSGESNSGSLGSTLSLGISKAKIKAHIMSPTAAIRTGDASAEFYFVFSTTNAANSWSKGLTSPNQYALIRMDKKSDHRELTVAATGTGGVQTGVDDKSAVPLRILRLKPGVYLVTPVGPLEPGEYAFLPLGGGGGRSDLYDFGVDRQ